MRPTRLGAAAGRGFTLIELAIVLVLVGLLSAMAVPSMSALVQRHRLLEAGHVLQADVALARDRAVAQRRTAYVVLQPGRPWCWAVSLDQPVDCRRAAAPTSATVLKQVSGERFGPQILALAEVQLAIDGRQGLRQGPPVQAQLVAIQGPQLAVHLGPMGRASLCSPGSAWGHLASCANAAAAP